MKALWLPQVIADGAKAVATAVEALVQANGSRASHSVGDVGASETVEEPEIEKCRQMHGLSGPRVTQVPPELVPWAWCEVICPFILMRRMLLPSTYGAGSGRHPGPAG